MRSEMIFIAAQQLDGGTKDEKTNVVTPHITPVGTEVDEDEAKKLGLSAKDLTELFERGVIVRQAVRSAGEADDETLVDGLSAFEFTDFLDRFKIAYPANATIEQLLQLQPVPFDGVSTIDLASFLDLHAVPHAADATADDMLKLLLDHGREPARSSEGGSDGEALAAKAAAIDGSMDVKAIKAELNKLQVPFESDANKPALALLLARSRG